MKETISKKDTGIKNRVGRFLALTLAVLLAATVLLWGVSSSWGSVTIKRYTLVTDDGKEVSGVLYIPKTATAENPAPCVINMHGRANTAHVCDTWALEEARRGYVVLSLDLFGCGESDLLDGGSNKSHYKYPEVWYDYLKDLSFVIPDQFVYVGFSMGNIPAYSMAELHPDTTIGNIQVFNFKAPSKDCQTNLCVIKAQSDQYNYGQVGGLNVYEASIADAFDLSSVSELERDKIYGSFEERTARQYVFAPRALHQSGGIDSNVICALLTFLDQCAPMPNYIAPNSLIWGFQQILALVCYVFTVAFILAVGNLLLQIPYFGDAIRVPLQKNRCRHGVSLALNIVVSILIPTCTFITFSTWGVSLFDKNPVFKAKNFNGIIFWLFLNTLITICIMIYNHKRDTKKGEKLGLAEYVLVGEGETRIPLPRVAKAFAVAALTVFFAFSWLAIVDTIFGVNYQFWILGIFSRVNVKRFFGAIPYMFVIFCVLFIAGIGMNTARRLPGTGNAKRDMARDMAINCLIAAAPVAILLLIQYGGCWLIGTGFTPFALNGGSVGALNFAFGFPFLMGSMAIINTYFYRKTGSIWVGAFMGAMTAALCAYSGQPLTL